MSEIRENLSKIDDDYLIGISNKGIVKRAYKDLEQASLGLVEEEKGLNVSVDDCSCQLVLPIGESKCNCPSRSICKHIVMAVLYAKKQFELTEQVETACGQAGITTVEEVKNCPLPVENEEKFPQICAYQIEDMRKKLGAGAFKKVWEYMRNANEPEITVGAVITVYFTDIEIAVKLLEPVAYSTCSCHKKELCIHKAQAILYYQLSKGILQKEQIKEAAVSEEKQLYDFVEIAKLEDVMQDLLGELLFTGVSRASSEVVLSCERMAVMSHNLLLPEYERMFRSLSENLDLYFKRHASFSVDRLLKEVTELYQKAEALKQAAAWEDVSKLAGKNRSEYVAIKPLSLMGMGRRYFRSKIGYEGDTTYFLEERSGEWYTYTNARPVFYEKNKRQRAFSGKEVAPWNLNCNMEELSKACIYLENGKINEENRLSSTKEAVAEITGQRSLSKEVVDMHTYDDFEKLFEAKFGEWKKIQKLTETQKLAIVKPESVEEAAFDNIAQKFSMKLLDKEGRVLIVKVSYSKEENYTIRYLERLYKRIQRGKKELPLFLGIVYLEEGRMKMYPIEDYEVMA